jgi:hypothetical protein
MRPSAGKTVVPKKKPVDDEAPTGPPITKVWKWLTKSRSTTLSFCPSREYCLGRFLTLHGAGQKSEAMLNAQIRHKCSDFAAFPEPGAIPFYPLR